MNTDQKEITPILGTSMGGGFYAGRIIIEGQAHALILAPKSEGEISDIKWFSDYSDIAGAKSFHNGQANTAALAEAGSYLGEWARSLSISGHDDWYVPSQDELEIIYRNLKPSTTLNSPWNRSGINISAVIPTRSYTPDFPVQTLAELFMFRGSEAFESEYYWTSTQHAGLSRHAWGQNFGDGCQYGSSKSDRDRGRARVVRRLEL